MKISRIFPIKIAIILLACLIIVSSQESVMTEELKPDNKKSQEETVNWKDQDQQFWQKRLSPEQYKVCRQAATEMPFSGKYYKDKRAGDYLCASCGQVLFSSDTKYDSGSGWPSFSAAAAEGRVELRTDNTHGMQRVEAVCARCGAHLGHVFDDGPTPTGQRFCINSLSLTHELDLEPKEK